MHLQYVREQIDNSLEKTLHSIDVKDKFYTIYNLVILHN